MRSRQLLLGVAAGLIPPAMAAAQDPEIRQFDVATLEMLGQQIYQQDGEAGRATDVLLAQKMPTELQSEKVRGWIVEMSPGRGVVRFVRDGAAGLEAAYDVVIVTDTTPRLTVPVDRTLMPQQKAQFLARELALKNIDRPCSDRYNTVVLKDPQGDGWLAWALAATTKPKTWFIGGNYRFTISADGSQILRKDALSHSCLTMTTAPEPKAPEVVAQFSTQLVSNIPVETAIFVNLQSKTPMYVGTSDHVVWGIVDGKMKKVDVSAPSPKP